jgi:hypothetical protein
MQRWNLHDIPRALLESPRMYKDTMYAYHQDKLDVLVLTTNHNRSHTLIEKIVRMELELCEIASRLDKGDLCGEQLDRVTAQVAGIECQRVHILGLLQDYCRTITSMYCQREKPSRLDHKKILK